jgi:hypothetical protein
MQQIRQHMTPVGPVNGVEVNLLDLTEWRPTVTQVRDTILKGWVTGGHMLEGYLPPEVLTLAPSQDDVESIADCCETAIRAGRLIDFGAWTNEVIKHGSNRGGPLYNKGAIGHPFGKPYVFMHTWEGDGSGVSTSVYMVNPLEPDKLAGGDYEAVELQPLKMRNGVVLLMISDRVFLQPGREGANANANRYACEAIPSVWRFLPGAEAINKQGPAEAAAANVLDPSATALLILSTRGIERETVTASEKLQKARRKNGKPPIPPYDRVQSQPYVTAIEARRARGRSEPKGGTHASPIPHLRMGHPRTYASGVQVFVRDALVNMSEEARKAWITGSRSHYEVKR